MFLEQRHHRLRRYIPPGKTRSSGGNDHIHTLIGDPGAYLLLNDLHIIGDNGPVRQDMARCFEPVNEGLPGPVVGQRAAI